MHIPEHLFYSADHEWLRAEGPEAVIGITEFAAGELGDIVFVEMPTVGQVFKAGTVFGSIEAVKTVSDLIMPVSGVIIEINTFLTNIPETVNNDPYNDGWLIRIVVEDKHEIGQLMDGDDYQKHIGN